MSSPKERPGPGQGHGVLNAFLRDGAHHNGGGRRRQPAAPAFPPGQQSREIAALIEAEQRRLDEAARLLGRGVTSGFALLWVRDLVRTAAGDSWPWSVVDLPVPEAMTWPTAGEA